MKDKSLPVSVVRRCIMHDPLLGELTWKLRTPDDFSDTGRSKEHNCNNWNARFAGQPALDAVSNKGYRRGRFRKKQLCAHHVMWALVTGQWPSDEIDHINGDPGDNRFINLREATRTEQCRNRAVQANSKSRIPGVSWSDSIKRWRVRIGSNGKRIAIGSYHTKNEAIIARRAAEKALGYHPNHGRDGGVK